MRAGTKPRARRQPNPAPVPSLCALSQLPRPRDGRAPHPPQRPAPVSLQTQGPLGQAARRALCFPALLLRAHQERRFAAVCRFPKMESRSAGVREQLFPGRAPNARPRGRGTIAEKPAFQQDHPTRGPAVWLSPGMTFNGPRHLFIPRGAPLTKSPYRLRNGVTRATAASRGSSNGSIRLTLTAISFTYKIDTMDFMFPKTYVHQ
ncbi:hypothetical protein AAFF_G00294090 [Aldrovandia affinis]|uniref:Uncharacterized protein n=1 Tax=Aldrovandia affinis TaxID=143900 RepID=A0AAD7R907_9TELE|nr:hypothetical protein AAFF_G00294090 [Aldrovandia affinis]